MLKNDVWFRREWYVVSGRFSLRSGVSKLFWQGVREHVRILDRKVRLPRQPKMCLGSRECTYGDFPTRGWLELFKLSLFLVEDKMVGARKASWGALSV